MPAATIHPSFVRQTWRELTAAQLEHIRSRLGYIPTGDRNPDYSGLMDRYERGQVDLAVLQDDDGAMLAFTFFGIEEVENGEKDLVIFAGESRRNMPGFSVARETIQHLVTIAQQSGCTGIVMRTVRPAFARLFEEEGFFVSEYILRKAL